jgi:hypothetical protein
VLQHEFMVGEALPAPKQRTLPPLFGGHPAA